MLSNDSRPHGAAGVLSRLWSLEELVEPRDPDGRGGGRPVTEMLRAYDDSGEVILVPMQSADDLVRHWRDQAAEIRAVAENMRDPTAIRDLFDLADKWEAMAKHAEERAARKVAPFSK